MRPEKREQFKTPELNWSESGIATITVAGAEYTYDGLDPETEWYTVSDHDGQKHQFKFLGTEIIDEQTDEARNTIDPEVTKRRRDEAKTALVFYLKETAKEARSIWRKAA